MLSADDRIAITDLINRHGHFVDNGQLDRMHEILADDVAYDVTDLGGGVLNGVAELNAAALALGQGNPLAHHVTNIVLDAGEDGVVTASSKGIGIMANGSIGSVTYKDRVERRKEGWRIVHRTVLRREAPLKP